MPYSSCLEPTVRSLWSRSLLGSCGCLPNRLSFQETRPLGEVWGGQPVLVVCSTDDGDDDLDVGDDDSLTADDPLADEESSFDDFDDDFDDDFEEEETDPDWDHPDDLEPEAPPPGKPSGGKK